MAQTTTNFVCDRQETIDAGVTAKFKGTFSVGTADDANTIWQQARNAWLDQKVSEGIFNVNKEVPTEYGIMWQTCDLATETANTSTTYRLLNVPHGDHIGVTGLDDAVRMQDTIRQQYLDFVGIGSTYQTWTEWPQRIQSTSTSTVKIV